MVSTARTSSAQSHPRRTQPNERATRENEADEQAANQTTRRPPAVAQLRGARHA